MLISALAYAGLVTTAVASCGPLPRYHLTIQPEVIPEGFQLKGHVLLDGSFTANDTLLILPNTMANRPSAQYGADGIIATDDLGPLPLGTFEVAQGPSLQPSRYWVASRDTEGPLSFSFTAKVVSGGTGGPHFDLRLGTGGLAGSMWAFAPAPNPESPDPFNITVSWDMPETMGAAFTYGDGVGPHSHSITGPISRLTLSWFMVGDISAEPAMPSTDDKFGMYWLTGDEPPFSTSDVASDVQRLLEYATEFWQDDSGLPYRVFVQANLASSSTTPDAGGTALVRSFMVGYNRAGVTAERLQTLLAHEVSHEWTPWGADTLAEQSRYNEGGAEYWSLRLLWRMGSFTTEEYYTTMNQRLYDYYNNAAVNLSDAATGFGGVAGAQRIPYGRGMIHFANMDAQMRAASNGTRSLDDLAVPFVSGCEAKLGCGAAQWFPIVEEALGQAGVEEWHQVGSGAPLIKPQDGSLGPCFEVVQKGSNPTVWGWEPKQGVDIDSDDCMI